MSELCVYPTLSTFSCQHLLGNSSHSNVKSLQAIAFFVGGFPFLPLFVFDNHDKNHWFDQLQEVHWKGCSLRTSLPTGACGGLKLHSIHPGKLPNTQRIWTQKAPNRNGCGSHFFGTTCFFGWILHLFHQLSCFLFVCFAKKRSIQRTGNICFSPPVGLLLQEPTVQTAVTILRGLKDRYAAHHGVSIQDAALVAAATLSVTWLAGCGVVVATKWRDRPWIHCRIYGWV